jgi:tetratricopeptide (TPR) repeat protein
VRVSVQLIDARTDTHLWAEHYDRDATDVFAIETEIAQQIADQLRSKLSPAEKAAIKRAPTSDIGAFDLYSRARNIFLAATNSNSGKEDLLEAADLLNQALARDSSYFEAYCQLGGIHDLLYILGHDHSPRRLGLAEAAVETALRLRPNAGEAHLARATHLYSGYLNYDEALTELEVARKSLPNDCRVFALVGLIQNRRGKFEEALAELEHGTELDPRDVYRLQQVAVSYWALGRYSEARKVNDRALAIEPNNVQLRMFRANLDLAWKADTRAVHQVIESLWDNNPRAIHQIADSWVLCALADRDPTTAKAALIAAGENTPLNDNAVHFSRSFVEGWIARLEKDEPKARVAFESARSEQEKIVEAQPDYAPPLCVLGVIDAALGRKQEALSECRRAVQLLPVEKDASNGPLMIEWFAISAAWVGEKDLAFVVDEGVPAGELLNALDHAARRADAALRDMVQANPALDGMGTTLTALLWSDGKLPFGSIDLRLVFMVVVAPYFIWVRFYLDGVAAAALDVFRPLLAVSDAEFLRLRYELTTLPAQTTRIVTSVVMAVFLLNAPYPPDEIWDHLPREVQGEPAFFAAADGSIEINQSGFCHRQEDTTARSSTRN